MARDPNCVFCRVVSGEIPASVVHQDRSIIAFLDINPLADGHVLIVPREHYVGLTDMHAETCSAFLACVPTLGRALLDVTGAKGFNVLINQGEVAGQVVQHVHVHLIPRKSGDGLGYRWMTGDYDEGVGAKLVTAYQAALAHPQ